TKKSRARPKRKATRNGETRHPSRRLPHANRARIFRSQSRSLRNLRSLHKVRRSFCGGRSVILATAESGQRRRIKINFVASDFILLIELDNIEPLNLQKTIGRRNLRQPLQSKTFRRRKNFLTSPFPIRIAIQRPLEVIKNCLTTFQTLRQRRIFVKGIARIKLNQFLRLIPSPSRQPLITKLKRIFFCHDVIKRGG